MATVIVAYAVTNLFFTKSQTSDFSKKQIFQFDLDTGLSSGEVGPGDSFSVSPVIFNDATEEMYVFIQVDMPETANGMLYSFEADEEWTLVESGNGTVVYAYGTDEMTLLGSGDSTSALTNQMTMQSLMQNMPGLMTLISQLPVLQLGQRGCLRFLKMHGMNAKRLEKWNSGY